MIIGFARTSTIDQIAGLDAQIAELESCGIDRIFTEQVSSVAKRDQLNVALDYLRDGDVLVVTKLDRLARSVADLVKIIERVKLKGASLKVLAMNLDRENWDRHSFGAWAVRVPISLSGTNCVSPGFPVGAKMRPALYPTHTPPHTVILTKVRTQSRRPDFAGPCNDVALQAGSRLSSG